MSAQVRLRTFVASSLTVFAQGCASAPPTPPARPSLPPVPTVVAVAPSVPPPAPVESPPALPDAVRELQRLILGGQGAASVVESLTTEVGPRLAGSPGDKLAVAWALRAMRERGLVNVRAEPVKVPVWERGVETASILGAVPRPLAISALGWSGATPPRGIEAELVRFDSMDALTSADPKIVAGKIVFLDVKMRETAETTGYGAAVAARWRGPMDAAKKGAVAVVIRSISADSSRVPHTGNMRREKDVRSALPAAALSNADADLLERTLTAHGGVRLALRLGPRWLPDAESANVVGEIPGREIPGEIVLLAAHLDSWDLAEGALDDGAGCGIVLEAGRALAALPTRPRRTVRVVLFAAEENSLAGGKQYAKVHAAELGAHVAGLEADFGTGKVVHVKLKGAPEARSRFAPVAQMLGPLGVTAPDEVAWGGADLSPLHALGVPVVDLAQEPVRYFDAHHSANDTFARIDPATLSQATAAFATATWGLAEMSGDLGRIPEADRDR